MPTKKYIKAIKAFQEAHGLDIDGIVGPKTTAALHSDIPHIAFGRQYIGRVDYAMGTEDLIDDANGMIIDCSAFFWRCHGMRKLVNKRWRNTDWIVGDLLGKQTVVERIPSWEPGCFGVYGKKQNGGHTGHIAFMITPEIVLESSDSGGGVIERLDKKARFAKRVAEERAFYGRLKSV